MGHAPSPQQKVAYRWVRDGQGNLILIAVAGAGKTTTVLNMSTMMQGSVAYCAYNRKIADEIAGKLKAANIPSRIQAGTFHSFGRRNWSKVAPKAQISKTKIIDMLPHLGVPEEFEEFVKDLVSLAKQRAFGVLEKIEDERAWWNIVDHYDVADSLKEDRYAERDDATDQKIQDGIGYSMLVYKKSLEMDDQVIDFDDMILAPLVHNARIWKNNWICVDEAQDTNPARRELAKRMLDPMGRAVFVGDPAQAIYGFTGADNDSLDIIKKEFNCAELPLTVTYRCPKAVVAMAQHWVKHIVAHDSAPEGAVVATPEAEFQKLGPEWFTTEAAMLCRTTAPLVAQAYTLIRRGIACHVEGKSIGRGLLNLIDKWKTNNLETLMEKMDAHLIKECRKFIEKKQEDKAERLTDNVETIRVMVGALPAEASVADLKAQINKLFGDTPENESPKNFTLSTVHKSKGREWDTVYLYDRMGLMPSKFARQDWQVQQENNLIYVAITRAKKTLVEVVR